MDRLCLECGDILKGRVDKKYCSDLCRNSYNNKLNSRASVYVRSVNSILRKNRKILQQLTPSRTVKAPRIKLQQHGFNFGFHTHVYTNKKGVNYFFCYDYGYLPVENDHIILVKKNARDN
ncbi:MAG: hypothetical protein K0Q95_1872 [Bacteroidota bacterium]|jgi:hypothetical protein|nr:hypothetical protein [Bacteroidota bacterium]